MVWGDINKFEKAIYTANSANKENIQAWLRQSNAAFQQTGESYIKRDAANYKRQKEVSDTAYAFAMCVCMSDPPSGYDQKKLSDMIYNRVSKCTKNNTLKTIISDYTSKYKSDVISQFEAELEEKEGKPFKITLDGKVFKKSNTNTSESLSHPMNEGYYDEDEIRENGPKDDGPIDYDKIYSDLYNHLSMTMSECIGPRENWLCFKKIEDEMKFLKESADKEINAKIDLVCKTGGNSHSLLKYPFKAEGLKGMWARYSSELQSRIDNRIAQIAGCAELEFHTAGTAAKIDISIHISYWVCLRSIECNLHRYAGS